MICPDCRGSGSILLLISARPCLRCGGSGRTPSLAANAEQLPASSSSPDSPSAPRSVVEKDDATISYWYEGTHDGSMPNSEAGLMRVLMSRSVFTEDGRLISQTPYEELVYDRDGKLLRRERLDEGAGKEA